jgi:hypothetical protein
MARRNRSSELEDVTHLAGWMYADLLLALMVIFLATISFVPLLSAPADGISQSSSTRTNLGKNYKLGLSFVYDNFDAAQITQDISLFKVHEGLSANSRIIYAQLTGGYDPKLEDENTGKVRALDFSLKLNRSLPSLFSKSATYISATTSLKSNEIGLKITFSDKVK